MAEPWLKPLGLRSLARDRAALAVVDDELRDVGIAFGVLAQQVGQVALGFDAQPQAEPTQGCGDFAGHNSRRGDQGLVRLLDRIRFGKGRQRTAETTVP